MRHALHLFSFMVIATPAFAQTTIPREYDKTVKTAEVVASLGADLFGEETNLYTGSTTFVVTDVDLPGNNALSVSVGRKFTVTSRDQLQTSALLTRDGGFADWDLEIPHLRGVFAEGEGWQVSGWDEASRNSRCGLNANAAEPPIAAGAHGGFFAAAEYWGGNSLYLPGSGEQTMMVALDQASNPYRPSDGGQYTWVTASQWYFSCKPQTANGVPGDAFVGHAPDGTRYTFDWIVSRFDSIIDKPYKLPLEVATSPAHPTSKALGGADTPQIIQDPNVTSLSREEVWILPSRVEDRFGNSVVYTYDPVRPWRLLSIVASDGRHLTVAYNASGHIATVSDGARVWGYTYGNGLTEVSLPDQSTWLINFSTLRHALVRPAHNPDPRQCTVPPSDVTQYTYAGTITHPAGAIGNFTFYPVRHHRAYVPKRCIRYSADPSDRSDFAWWPRFFEVMALTRKTIAGPGITSGDWTYVYASGPPSWAEECAATSCSSANVVSVTGPNEFRRYTFSNKYGESEGKLLKVDTGSSASTIVRTDTTSYMVTPTSQAYPALIGSDPFNRSDRTSEVFRPTWRRTSTQQGRTFTWQVASDCGSGSTYCFDHHARPTKVIKTSSP